jgi:hypothetical protein
LLDTTIESQHTEITRLFFGQTLSKIQLGIRNFKPTLRKAAERRKAIQAYLAIHAGVSPEAVDEFDRAYEAKRKAGDDSEPGDDLKAPPYRKQRQIR